MSPVKAVVLSALSRFLSGLGHALGFVWRIVRAGEYPVVLLFFAAIMGAAIYIGTTGNLGIYYDYYLVPANYLIHQLNQGGLSVDQYLSAREAFKPHIQLFTHVGGLRFHPLYKTDYALLLNLFGDPAVLWIYRGLSFLLLSLALYKVSAELARSRLMAVAIIALLIFPHAGFWYVWTTLTSTTEGQASVAISLCLFFYAWYLRRPGIVILLLLMLFAALALCFKEPTFVAFAAFAGTHLLLSWWGGTRREQIACLAMIASTAAIGVWYFFDEIFRYLTHNDPSYAETIVQASTALRGFQLLSANLRDYETSDPALVFLLPPLLLLQLWRIICGKVRDERQRLITAMLVAGAAWFVSLLALGLSIFPYYTVPAYCFAVPGIAGMLADIARESGSRTWRGVLTASVTIVLLVLSVVPFRATLRPQTWDVFIDNRIEIRNWGKLINTADAIIKENAPRKTYFYFYKSPRDGTVELRESFIVFLVARGFLPKDFDLAHAVPDNPSNPDADSEWATSRTPWSWNRKDRRRPIERGDYLIVNSWWPLNTRAEIDSLLGEYDIAYATNGNLNCALYSFARRYQAIVAARNVWRWLRGAELISMALDPREQGCSLFSSRKNFYIFRRR